MPSDPDALFQDHIYRVTGAPVVANTESTIGAVRDLHLATCRTLRKYPEESAVITPLTDAEVEEAWIRAIDEDTTNETLATEWPFSADTGWCPVCIVKKLKPGSDGVYRHPRARSPKWRPGIPLGCRFPLSHGLGYCGCEAE